MLNGENSLRIISDISPFTDTCSADIIDLSGIVVGSTDGRRVGTFSRESLKALEGILVYEKREANTLFRYQPLLFANVPIGVALIWGESEIVEKRFDLLTRLISLLLTEIVQESRNVNDQDLQNEYISEWLFSDQQHLLSDETFVLRGKLLGIDVKIPRNIALLRFMPGKGVIEGSQLVKRIQTTVKNSIVYNANNLAFFAERTVILCMASSDKEIESLLQVICNRLSELGMESIACGVGVRYTDPVMAATSYQNAESACKIAEVSDEESIVFYDSVSSIEKLMGSIPVEAQEGFVGKVFESIPKEEVNEWANILAVYFKHNGSIYRAAEELYMHKNTLQYKINKIKEKTNYDPRNIQDSLVLNIATVLYKKLDQREKKS